MTVQVFTNYSAPTMPMYGQPGYMPMNYGYPSLFMSGGCMPPMVGGCYDTFGGMGYGCLFPKLHGENRLSTLNRD